ncbi:MAG: 4Fe-4S binding protein [Bacteroidales bacterium]|nr:4Fe-4S binding protein [Candidatus Cacconaster merdequi]
MLRKIRIVLSAIFFALTTLLFLDFTGTLHIWFGWMAKIQALPAVLALNFAVVAILAIITVVFGRVYCSVICPLGIFQDIVNRISSRRKGKKNRFSFTKERKWLRYGVLVIFVALLVFGLNSIAILIAPYSAYGRIASNLFAPLYGWGNNLLVFIAERLDSYSFYSTDVYIKSIPAFIVAAVTFVVIVIFAWKGGRSWCNNICPVGTVLGTLSRCSIFAPVIDTDKCVNCGVCGKRCKASCIDTANHKIDYSRCVVCMDCIENCKSGAIKYKLRCKSCKEKKQSSAESSGTDKGRRNFILAGAAALTAATLKAQEEHVDGGLAVIEDKKVPDRETPLKPAGSQSLRNFSQHCTACQLCVAECPNKVLRPSTKLETFMQPEMSYERGYCRPECTRCSEVCPAGAIKRVSREEKSSIQIGHAVVIPDNCIVNRDGVACGNCARHCPVGAIKMVPVSEGSRLKVPAVRAERCIGCGACENLCPARPFSAIYVEGHLVHKEK